MERVVGRKEGNKFGEVGGGAKRERGKESMIAPKKHESFLFYIFNQLVFYKRWCQSVCQSVNLSASLSISQLSCELVSKSVSLSIFIPISLSISVSKSRFVSKSVNQSVCLSLSVCQCVF